MLLCPLTLLAGRRTMDGAHLGRWLLALYFLWVTISALLGSDAERRDGTGDLVVLMGSGRFEGLYTQLCYAAVLLGMSWIRPRRGWVLTAASLGVLAMGVIIALQYAGLNPLGFYPRGRSIYTNYEFQGTLGNIDMIAGYLALLTPLLLGSWVTLGGHGGWVLLPAGFLAVLVTLCMDVQSGLLALLAGAALLIALLLNRPEYRRRGLIVLGGVLICVTLRWLIGLPWIDGLKAPWLCEQRPDALLPKLTGSEPVLFPWQPSLFKLLPALLGAGLLALCPVIGRLDRRKVSLRMIVAAALAMAALAVLAVWLLPIPQSMGSLWELHEILNGRMQDSFGSERFGIWRHTLLVAREHLLFGTGPDTFLRVMGDHLAETGVTFIQTFDNPHNMLLAILVQNGLPALVLFAAGMAVTALRAARSPGGMPLAAALCCYLVQGMFSFSLCIVSPMFWAVAGLAICDAPRGSTVRATFAKG